MYSSSTAGIHLFLETEHLGSSPPERRRSSSITFIDGLAERSSGRNQVFAHGEQGELEAISHLAFRVDRRKDVLDRLLGQAEVHRNLTVRSSCDDAADDVTLAWCQLARFARWCSACGRVQVL